MKFELKNWKLDYVKDCAKNANNKKIADNLRDGFNIPYTENDAANYINSVLSSKKEQLCKAIIINNEAVGSIGVFVKENIYRKSAELGYWLSERFWGKGIMTKAINLICSEAFNIFDINRIYAEPFARNVGSRSVLEKNGFVLEGILKQSAYKCEEYIDCCMYALLKTDKA